MIAQLKPVTSPEIDTLSILGHAPCMVHGIISHRLPSSSFSDGNMIVSNLSHNINDHAVTSVRDSTSLSDRERLHTFVAEQGQSTSASFGCIEDPTAYRNDIPAGQYTCGKHCYLRCSVWQIFAV
jgi:hypothetical protein